MFRAIASVLAVVVAGASAASGDEGPAAARPWPGQYKIRPEDKARLTPADVVGPDGLVYPNWTRCGVQGGIPPVAAVARIEQFGGRADDGRCDADALDAGCVAAAAKGGGAVLLGEGTYHLDRPVTVRGDGVVLRGAGARKTKLLFRYAVGADGIAFYWPPAGSRVGRNTRIELHAKPAGLQRVLIQAGGQTLHQWQRSQHSGNTFSTATRGEAVLARLGDGPAELTAAAEYADGTKRTCRLPIVVDSKYDDRRLVPDSQAAICFAGRGPVGAKLPLARDGRRGGMTLTLKRPAELGRGDCLLIDGPATERWKALTQNACRWGMYRRYQVRVEGVAGPDVRIEQPLRIDFPVIDGSFVQEIVPIRRCGVEDLAIEQTENLWITSVLFSYGWECWARGVTVRMCGRFPVYGHEAKWCEIRDCVFDDAHFKGGGGTAYAGWQNSHDCLMEGVETFKLRHAPLFQWAASGCVIRKGVFHESDAQWHAGWTNENLIEQCVVRSVRGHGGYGFGMWASPPGDAAHGPNGPRNVVYNCDVTSQRTGVWMGGMNECWLILYSRFTVDSGPGVSARTASFDHVIRGNVFVLKDARSPMVELATSDCVGVEVRNNHLYGGDGRVVAGKAAPAAMEGNEAHPLGETPPPRPRPAVESIYEWQKANVKP